MYKSSKELEVEFRNQFAALFIVMFGAIVAVALWGSHNSAEREKDLEARSCVLQNRIFIKNEYCGKACFQDHYLHEYQCVGGRENHVGPAELYMRAKGRDDYYTRNR